jgi:hypothetical protein
MTARYPGRHLCSLTVIPHCSNARQRCVSLCYSRNAKALVRRAPCLTERAASDMVKFRCFKVREGPNPERGGDFGFAAQG